MTPAQSLVSESAVDVTPPKVARQRSALAVYSAAALYASFVVFFPWGLITGREGFRDFDRYVATYTNPSSLHITATGWDAVRIFFTREVLWGVIVRGLVNWVGDATTALRFVSFFICVVWGVYLFSRIPIKWALLFLLNPRSIEVALSNLRNGFAWALVILGIGAASRSFRIASFAITPFIHSSSAGLLALYGTANALLPKVKSNVGTILLVVIPGVAIGLTLTVFNEIVLGGLGDRRVGEGYVRGGGSLLQSSFWLILLVTQLTSGMEYVRRNALTVSLLVWYVVMNPFIPWSHRLWAAFIPVIAVSIWGLPRQRRAMILYCWLGYIAVSYVYWTKAIAYLFPHG